MECEKTKQKHSPEAHTEEPAQIPPTKGEKMTRKKEPLYHVPEPRKETKNLKSVKKNPSIQGQWLWLTDQRSALFLSFWAGTFQEEALTLAPAFSIS